MSSNSDSAALVGPAPIRKADIAVFVLFAAVFAWTIYALVVRWDQEGSYYSHGWLVPPIAVWIAWRKRRLLAATPRRPSRAGLLLLIPSLFAQILSVQWKVGSMSGFALIGALAGLIWTMYGWKYLRLLAFPLAFLVFMVALPEVLIETVSFKMKLAAAWAAAILSNNVIGIPAVREGSYIYVPAGTLIVDSVCSGLKYLIALLAFGAFYAHISPLRITGKWTLFLLSAPVAYIANVARVTLMIIVAQWRGIESVKLWYFHDLFGFVLFIVAFIILFLIESLMMSWRKPSVSPPAEPTQIVHDLPGRGLNGGIIAALAVTAVVIAWCAWPRPTTPASEILKSIPLSIGNWTGKDYTYSDEVYNLLGTRDVISRVYRSSEGEQVSLVIVMAQQMRRRTHPPEQCFAGEGYAIESSSVRKISDIQPGLSVCELILTKSNTSRLSWYFFKSGSRYSTNYWFHQAAMALSSFTSPNTSDIMVRVETNGNDVEKSRELNAKFLRLIQPFISQLP